jgi:integrase
MMAPMITEAPSPALQEAADRAAGYARAAHARNSLRAYRAGWSDYTRWCDVASVRAIPATPEGVGAYLAARAGALSPATLANRLAAISYAHRLGGHHLDLRHPAIRSVLRGIRRGHGAAPRRAAPVRTVIARAMVADCNTATLRGLRDRAILLLGLASALRRSELSALDAEHLAFTDEGVRILVARSKTDGDGIGETIGVVASAAPITCPVAAVRQWLDGAKIESGAVFRNINRHGRVGGRLSDRAISEIVKARANAVGLDPRQYSGHSLRSGFITEAAAAGCEERDIARQSRHRSLVVLRSYIREGSVFVRNPSARIGL